MDWRVDREDWATHHRQQRAGNRARANNEFAETHRLACSCGLSLYRHSDIHYSLTVRREGQPSWRWNLYPGNRRITRDHGHPRTPRLSVPYDWTLMDVVRACLELRGRVGATQD